MKKFILLFLMIFLFSMKVVAKETVNVAFTIDNNYPVFTMLAINSILQNNLSNSDYRFFIIENNLSEKNKIKMSKYVEDRGQAIQFIKIDTKVIDDGDYLFGFSNRITSIGMARILLPELLPQNVHKVLYLDADILVTADLKPLFDTDIKNYPVAMAVNILNETKVGPYVLNNENYYNSGMILMNLDIWRNENISNKMLEFVRIHKSNFILKDGIINDTKFLYPDQDLINIILDDRIKKVEQKWNMQIVLFSYEGMEDITGINHFIGATKPWNFPVKRDEWLVSYYRYWNKSGLWAYKFYYGFINLKYNYLCICEMKLIKYLNIINEKLSSKK